MRTLTIGIALGFVQGLAGIGWSHPGDTDRYGGHTEGPTKVYHVHTCMVAGNKKSKVYHVPGGQFYRQMATTSKDKVCFGSEAEATKAGYRKSKR